MTDEIKTPESKNQKCQRVLNNWLYPEYHDIFNPRKPRPLMVGIAKVLEQHLPEGITIEDLKIALRSHYKMQNYMRAVLVESHRVNLQGEPVSEIPFEEKKIVKENLERLYKYQLENYLKRFTPNTETDSDVTPVEPPVAHESIPEKAIVVEPVAVEDVKPKKLTLKSKTSVETTPVIQAQPAANNGNCAKSKGLKVTLVLDPASLPNIDSTGMKKVPLKVQIGDTGLIATTEINSKSYRKALSSIEEYSADGCNVILQGAMKQYGVIDDAGLVVQPKKTASSDA